MYLSKVKTAAAVLAACLALTGSGWFLHQALTDEPPEAQIQEDAKAQPEAADADEPAKPITREEFDRLHRLIRPLPGEYAWRDEIPWQTRLQAAREKAVAEDKPIFILASANAFGLGRT